MTTTFHADEIFEMAEEIERNGARYYNRAVDFVSNPEQKKLLKELAVMENEHESTFAKLRAQLNSWYQPASVYDPDDQVALYLRAMADGHVFDIRANPCDMLKPQTTMKDILHIALECEKNSILFYLGIKDMIPSEAEKHKIDYIIHEERNHITLLSSQLALLKS